MPSPPVSDGLGVNCNAIAAGVRWSRVNCNAIVAGVRWPWGQLQCHRRRCQMVPGSTARFSLPRSLASGHLSCFALPRDMASGSTVVPLDTASSGLGANCRASRYRVIWPRGQLSCLPMPRRLASGQLSCLPMPRHLASGQLSCLPMPRHLASGPTVALPDAISSTSGPSDTLHDAMSSYLGAIGRASRCHVVDPRDQKIGRLPGVRAL